jgi:hypothetical protein
LETNKHFVLVSDSKTFPLFIAQEVLLQIIVISLTKLCVVYRIIFLGQFGVTVF